MLNILLKYDPLFITKIFYLMHLHIPISLVICISKIVIIIKEKFSPLWNSYDFWVMNYPILSECAESKYIRVVILVLFFLSGLMRKTGQKDTDPHSWFRHYFCSNLYVSAPRGPRGVKKSDFFFTNETVFLLR